MLWASPDRETIVWKALTLILLAGIGIWDYVALHSSSRHPVSDLLTLILCYFSLFLCAFTVRLPEFWVLAALAAAVGPLKYLVRRFPFLMPPPRGAEPRDGDGVAGQNEKK